MIVDFQHHFTPRELIKEDPGDRLILHYDAQGAPSYTIHSCSMIRRACAHDGRVRQSTPPGSPVRRACADSRPSRFVNDKAKKAERDYPGRFIGAAHAHPHGGPEAVKELNRCKHELGFQGVVITSETDGLFLDNPIRAVLGPRPRSSACSCSCIPRSSSITRSSSMASILRARSAANSR